MSVLAVAVPAEAGSLSTWRFNANQNQLEFSTDESVQPRAQLVNSPARLVIDLPGIDRVQAPTSRLVGGAIRQIRVGRLDAATTRIVVEFSSGYTIDPQQVRFRGASPTQWTVQLPEPQRLTADSIASSPASSSTSSPPAPVDLAVAQVEGIQITDDGLFVRTRGGAPEIKVERSRDRRSVRVNLQNAVLSAQLTQTEVQIDRFGVNRVQLSQSTSDPQTVQLLMEVASNSGDWQATVSNLGGIVMLPMANSRTADSQTTSSRTTSSRTTSPTRREPEAETPTPRLARPVDRLPAPARPNASAAAPPPLAVAQPETMATVQGVELNPVNNQLLITSDRPVAFTTRWQGGTYQVVLAPAQLANQVTGPRLTENSPLIRVRLRQDEGNQVVVSIQPASGVRFGTLNAVSPQLLALELQRSNPPSVQAPLMSNRSSGQALTPRSSSNAPLPRLAQGRAVVVIDPGHGGVDVGAVGINGIQEANIVLNVSRQVAQLLQQQGVQVILTRSDDTEVELEPRVQLAEQSNATLFVSIHANSLSLDRPDVNGVETYYFSSGQALAGVIQQSIISSLGMTDRGVRQARFYVLRKTTMPAVLVEIGFVTGSEDAPRLASSQWQSQMANAIVRGVLQYLQQGR
ncbi:MAG TPA: N-acetylmuramoyl-L-alanine amidase [Trichocoleus sp.]|jgi:N-acetylmuramoyl-L-alanine amidase